MTPVVRAQGAPPTLQNIRFPARISTPSGPLTLNGRVVRRLFGVDVYEVALYVQARSANPADHLTLAKRSRLAIRFLRELDNEQFTRALLAALRERINMTETPNMVGTMFRLSEVFSSVPAIRVGDKLTATIPGSGRMDFAINGATKGFKPITDGRAWAQIALDLCRRRADRPRIEARHARRRPPAAAGEAAGRRAAPLLRRPSRWPRVAGGR